MEIISFIVGAVTGVLIAFLYPKRGKYCHKMPQKVKRVRNREDLKHSLVGFTQWNSESTKNPVIIGKIHEHLRNASEIRLYITKNAIEYTATTRTKGQISGSCSRNSYIFFEFGIRKSGHRFDVYGEDRNDPTIKAFYIWWENLVKPYEEAFDKDFNL